jgi:peptidoglycan/LPS O-acetylase OafA/YrhL
VSTRQPHLSVVRSSEHIAVLDGVRGIAILSVLLFHFGQFGHGLPGPTVWIDKVFVKVFQAGWVGVDLFFVLSGFLITGILYDSKNGAHYFRNFYARRCLRIFPLYYATLFFFLVCLPRLLPSNDGVQDLTRDSIWYWTYLSNLVVAWRGWHVVGVLDHLWSLAIEEQFYLVWPVLVLICNRRRLLQLCAVAFVAALAVRIALRLSGYEVAAYVLSPARMDAIAIGAALAVIARQSDGLSRVAPAARRVMGLSGFAVGLTFLLRDGFEQRDLIIATIGHTLLACLFGSILVVSLTSTRSGYLRRWLESPVLTFFGQYSYALYLFHNPLLFFRPSSWSLQAVPTIWGSQLPGLLLYIAAATLLSIGLAVASWHLYEKQFLKLKCFFRSEPGPPSGERASHAAWPMPTVAHVATADGGVAGIIQGRR